MIEIRHLSKSYGSGTTLKDVNAVINDGDVIAVIGPSGIGKSTLLRCINLLERPSGGSILINGEDILDKSCDINMVRQKVGMVFQSFNLFGHLTAVENIWFPQMDILKRSRQEAYDRSMELLGKVGLAAQAMKYPDQMSGGQKQRVAIARALAMDPDILLFDEPTSALDPTMVGEVEAVIRDLANAGKTMMIVTHELRFARSVSNRVFYMDLGEIHEDGPTDEIFDNPKKERTRRFIRNLKVLEIGIDDRDFDFPAAYGRITEFCNRNIIPSRLVMRLQIVFEELVQRILVPNVTEPGIRFEADYSEDLEVIKVTVTYKGLPVDPYQAEYDLSMALIRGVVSVFNIRSTDEDNVVDITLGI